MISSLFIFNVLLVVDVPLYLFLIFFVFIFNPLFLSCVVLPLLTHYHSPLPLAKITPCYALSHPHGQNWHHAATEPM